MALSEIEKLERRYAENPQGLTFAPLAEVHRKNGEIQRALDLLNPGLAIHPDYIPASIVLGRCHLDLGDVQAAEMAFLHVLALDGENVIALKALADISERLLRFDDAARWLQTLLSLDRSNEEAREQLRRVETSHRQAEVGSAAASATAVDSETASGAAESSVAELGGASVIGEVSPAADVTPAGDVAPAAGVTSAAEATSPGLTSEARFEPPVAEPAGLQDLEPSGFREPDEGLAGIEVEKPAGMEIEEPVLYDEPVQPLDGLVGRDVETLDRPADEFRVETSEDIVLRSSGGSEFQVPDASQELFEHRAFADRPPVEEDGAAGSWSPAMSEATPEREPEVKDPEPMELDAPPLEPTAESITLSEPATRPESTAASEPVAEDEPALALEPAAEQEPAPASERPAEIEPAPRRAYAAGETGGRPVAQLLKDILSARPPAHAAAAQVRQIAGPGGSGAPTRPAADALSLSSVFGEEAPAAPPAMPTAGPGPGVSFDDFFGGSGATPASRTPRSPDPKNDDLDQFHAWLQNLKR
jgi:hypothetical protein